MTLTYFEGQPFTGQDFTETPLAKGRYEGCVFQQCQFTKADLGEVQFLETEFIDCDLSNAYVVKTALQTVSFTRCKLLGWEFESCHHFGFEVQFDQCQLNHATFAQVKLKKTRFNHCQLIAVDFSGADLTQADLQHCDLAEAIFDQTILEKADLRNARNYAIDPEQNHLKGAHFSLPEVVGLLAKYQLKIAY